MIKNQFRYLGAFLCTFLLAFFLIGANSYSAQVTLMWDASTDTDLAGYKVYYGTACKTYQTIVDVGKNTTVTIPTLQDGVTYYFAATAYNFSGKESGYSSEVTNIDIVNISTPVCQYSLIPTNKSFSSSGGVGSVKVNTANKCVWVASSNANWVIITSSTNVSGVGTINYSVSPNTSKSSRTGILTIAGISYQITQSGQRWRWGRY
jgi:hypothetical protein